VRSQLQCRGQVLRGDQAGMRGVWGRWCIGDEDGRQAGIVVLQNHVLQKGQRARFGGKETGAKDCDIIRSNVFI